MKRGRPPYPDLLTPREQEVLDLLREGLTNPQIAERLDISRSGAAYHVSEILSKLGVGSREEAAAWRPEAASTSRWRSAAFAPLYSWLREGRPATLLAGKAASAAVIMIALGSLIALVAALLVMSGRKDDEAAVVPPAEPSPVHAPDGRPGEAVLDSIIEALLTEDAAGLLARFGSAEVFAGDMTIQQWSSHFATSDRSLYAVKRHTQMGGAPPVDIDVIFSASRPDSVPGFATPEGWRFGVENGRVVRIWIGSSPRSFTFNLEELYDTYVVLPPVDDLPKPPEGHPLDTRTANPGVDSLLALVQARDIDGLIDSVAYRRERCEGPLLALTACQASDVDDVEVVAATRASAGVSTLGGPEFCSGPMSLQDAAYVQRWFDAWRKPVALHAIATTNRDFEFTPGQSLQADHEIMIVMQLDRYSWQVASLYEREGRIVGIRCSPSPVYPDPRDILHLIFTPPPADGALPALTRRSGVPVVDDVLDAIHAGDEQTLASLIDYEKVACVPDPMGIGSPPVCQAGEAPGTLLDVFLAASCEGGYVRPDQITIGGSATQVPGVLFDSDWRLYALLRSDPNLNYHGSEMIAVLVTSVPRGAVNGQAVLGAATLGFSGLGLRIVAHGCGPEPIEGLVQRAAGPTFLLAPP